jgi:hypothetical protein
LVEELELGLGEILEFENLKALAEFFAPAEFAARTRLPFARSSRVNSWAGAPFLSRRDS